MHIFLLYYCQWNYGQFQDVHSTCAMHDQLFLVGGLTMKSVYFVQKLWTLVTHKIYLQRSWSSTSLKKVFAPRSHQRFQPAHLTLISANKSKSAIVLSKRSYCPSMHVPWWVCISHMMFFSKLHLSKSTCNCLRMSWCFLTHLHWVQATDTRPPANATLQVTGAVGWRREGLVYKKNEVKALPRFLFFWGSPIITAIPDYYILYEVFLWKSVVHHAWGSTLIWGWWFDWGYDTNGWNLSNNVPGSRIEPVVPKSILTVH